MKSSYFSFIAIWMCLVMRQTRAQNEACKIVYHNDRHVFTFSESRKKLIIEAHLEEDNRPCSLTVKKPDQEKSIIFELKKAHENEKTQKNQNAMVEAKHLRGNWVLKLRFYQNDKADNLKGKYQISNLTVFAFPEQPAENEIEYQKVDNLTCHNNDTLHGRINLTEDFHMCCEYHRFRNPSMSKDINCCEDCIIIANNVSLNTKVNYNQSYLEFAIKAQSDHQPSPLAVACRIQYEGILELTMKFKASAYKATPPCRFTNIEAASVGLSAGLGLVLIVCVTTIYFWRKTNNKAKVTDRKLKEILAAPEMPEWAKPFHYPLGYLSLKEELGSGGFGVVIKAQAQNMGTSSDIVGGCNIVAVKTFKGGGKDELMKEGEIMSKLTEFHYNVINLLGVSQDTPEKGHRLLLVLDFCARGSLDVILKEKLNEIHLDPELKESEDFNMKLLVSWTYQIAMGMKFLASHSIIHGDLAARNILIDEDNNAKISDFGKAHRVKYDNIGVEVGGNQPMWWMAPEALQNQEVTMESDKWSYGVTVWEIFSLGKEPYSDRMSFNGVLDDLLKGFRMPLPERCPTEIYKQVILTCWKANSEKRPNWPELIDILYKMVDSKYLEKYSIIQATKRDNYLEMRNVGQHKNMHVHNYV